MLCRKWIRQTFLNSGMMWHDIQYYILAVLLLGADYSVYFCVSAIQYIMSNKDPAIDSPRIFECKAKDIIAPLYGFKPSENLNNMKRLQSTYEKYVAPDLRKGAQNLLKNSY